MFATAGAQALVAVIALVAGSGSDAAGGRILHRGVGRIGPAIPAGESRLRSGGLTLRRSRQTSGVGAPSGQAAMQTLLPSHRRGSRRPGRPSRPRPVRRRPRPPASAPPHGRARPRRRRAWRGAAACPDRGPASRPSSPGRSGRGSCPRAAARSRGPCARNRGRSLRLCGDRHLDLLDSAPVGGGAVLARDGGDGPRHLDVAGLGAPHLPRELHREPVGGRGQQRPRLEARDIGHRGRQPRRLARDPTLNTAVGPPWRITQSSTPSAERNSRHPCSLMPPRVAAGARKNLSAIPVYSLVGAESLNRSG